VHLGFADSKLPEVLDEVGINYVESYPWIGIPKESFGPDLGRALQESNLKTRPGQVDLDLQAEILGLECIRREGTG
jgi:hypothetical protein